MPIIMPMRLSMSLFLNERKIVLKFMLPLKFTVVYFSIDGGKKTIVELPIPLESNVDFVARGRHVVATTASEFERYIDASITADLCIDSCEISCYGGVCVVGDGCAYSQRSTRGQGGGTVRDNPAVDCNAGGGNQSTVGDDGRGDGATRHTGHGDSKAERWAG